MHLTPLSYCPLGWVQSKGKARRASSLLSQVGSQTVKFPVARWWSTCVAGLATILNTPVGGAKIGSKCKPLAAQHTTAFLSFKIADLQPAGGPVQKRRPGLIYC